MCLGFGRCGTVENAWPECLEEGSQNSVLSGLSGKLGRQERSAGPQPRLYVGLSVSWLPRYLLDNRGSVHSCSQYVTRPPFWHTQRTPPSWEITTATDPGSAPASL